jgi:hypothetical protein
MQGRMAKRAALAEIEARSYASQKMESEPAMKQLRIGDITIDAVIEREGRGDGRRISSRSMTTPSSSITLPPWSPRCSTQAWA